MTDCEKVLVQIILASPFLQLKWVASGACFTLQLENGAAHLVELMHAQEYLDHVSSSSSVCHAWDFNPSQSLLVAEAAQTEDKFCGSS